MRRLGLAHAVVRPLAALLLGTQLAPLPLLAQGLMASPQGLGQAWVGQHYDNADKKEKKKRKNNQGQGQGQGSGSNSYGGSARPGQSNPNRYGQSPYQRNPYTEQQDRYKSNGQQDLEQERQKKQQQKQRQREKEQQKLTEQQRQKQKEKQAERQRQATKDRYRGHPERWKDWDSNRWRNYNKTKVNVWTKKVNVKYNFYSYPGWATSPRWYYSRPWAHGWYGTWSAPPWGWWTGQSVVWGVSSLATAIILNNAINNAISARQPTIIVPDTSWLLYYGSVQAVDDAIVEFTVYRDGYDGGGNYQMTADCSDGLLNGDVPTSASEAQLVNAACQVAFGSAD